MRQQEKQGTRPTPSPGRALRDGLHDPARDAAQREWRSRTLPLSLADRARVQAAQAAIEARPPSSQVPQYRSSVDPRKARGRPTPRDSLSKRPRFFPLGLPVRRTPAASVVTTCRASGAGPRFSCTPSDKRSAPRLDYSPSSRLQAAVTFIDHSTTARDPASLSPRAFAIFSSVGF